jgi:hypothetical protein
MREWEWPQPEAQKGMGTQWATSHCAFEEMEHQRSPFNHSILSQNMSFTLFHGWNHDHEMGGKTSNRAQEHFCAFHKATIT